MPTKKVKNWKKHMVELFKDSLDRPVPVALLDDWPEIRDAMAVGQPAPATKEVLVAKIVRYALERDKANTWAVQMIYDYVVGKPQQAPAEIDGGRNLDERLEDVTTDHLNALTSQFVAAGGGLKPSQAQNTAVGQVAGVGLDLPEDPPGGPQGAGREPEMA